MKLIKNIAKNYFGKKLLWLFGIFTYGYSLTIHAIPITGLGLTPIGQIDTSSILYTVNSGYNRNYVGAFFFGIAKTGLSNPLYMCSDMLKMQKSLDGKYTGVTLARGVTLVFYDSEISSTAVFNSVGPLVKAISFDSYGKMTGSYDNNNFCAAPTAFFEGGTDNVIIPSPLPANGMMTGILKYGIYVEKEATSGTNVSINFSVLKIGTGSGAPVTDDIDINMVSCSVSMPTDIDFGNINVGDTTPVLSKTGELKVACTGSGPMVTIDYNATSPSVDASGTALVMKNTENQSQGVVRGFISGTAESDAGCTNKSSSMYFNGSQVTLIKTENNKENLFPLKWVLCPDSSPGLGKGNANATLNIIWK